MRPSKSNLPPIPPALADVALIDAPTCASSAGISLSQWHELVRSKKAPQAAIRQPRYSRWRLADIRAWLIERSKEAASDTRSGKQLSAIAKKAGLKAAANRAARASICAVPVPPLRNEVGMPTSEAGSPCAALESATFSPGASPRDFRDRQE